MKKYLFLLPILFITSLLFGQQPDTLSYQMDSVIVSAGRFQQPVKQIPFSIDVIGTETLGSTHENLSAENIFRYIPGVIVNNRSNLSEGDRIIIRGVGNRAQFGVRGIKILLDGIPLTFADGQSQLNNLDLNSIGKVELIRGPSSFLYGNSSGGVIYITSKNIDTDKFTFNPEYTFGSFGYRKISLNAGGKIGRNSLSVHLNKMNYEGYRENSSASTSSLNLISIQHINDNIKAELVFNYFDSPYLLNPSSLNKSNAENNPASVRDFVKRQGAGKKIRQGQAGITLSYQPNPNHKYELTFYGISRSMFNPIPGKIIRLNRIAGGLRSNYSTNFSLSCLNFTLLAGADFEFQNDVRTEFENNGLNDYTSLSPDNVIQYVSIGKTLLDQKEKVNGMGAFSKLEFSPIGKMSFSFGLRYDKYNFEVDDRLVFDGNNSGSLPMNNLSGMIGTVYSFNNSIQIFANFSNSFQTPTTSELSNTPDGSGGFNKSLKPELLTNYELGLRGFFEDADILYSLSFFKLITKNILIPYQSSNVQSDEIFFRNSGKAVNNGIELSAQWIPDDNFNINLAYTYSDFKFNDFAESVWVNNKYESFNIGGNRVPGIPQNILSLGIQYRSKFGLDAGISMNRTGEYFVNDTNGPIPNTTGNMADYINDGHTVININFSYDLKHVSGKGKLFFAINNLFDVRYNGAIVPNASANRFFEPAVSRNFLGGFSININ